MNHFSKKAKRLKRKIEQCYQSLGVNVNITEVQIIPVLQRFIFRIELLPGTRVQKIFNHAEDIQAALRLHLFYPFRAGTSILIAISEFDVKENRLLKILGSSKFTNSKMQIPIALGYDLMGGMYITDLAKLVHLLVIGPSGTGKSVALRCIVLSIIVRCPVNFARLILFDIGAYSLSVFENVKHLYYPIVKDIETGIVVLESLIAEMERRIVLGENECQSLPFLVCMIDEFDDTIASIENKEESKRFANSINSIIRRGRKVKVILILASHDPTLKNVNNININGIVPRVAFKCAKHHNSLTALGVTGAENLSGEGAILFKSQDKSTPVMLQGSFVTFEEIEKIMTNAPEGYDNIDMLEIKASQIRDDCIFNNIVIDSKKKELADILFWVLCQKTTSALQVQNHFHIGKRATEIMDVLYGMNIVTEQFSKQPREVIPECIGDLSHEALGLLEQHGYGVEQIEAVLRAKKNNIDVAGLSDMHGKTVNV